MACHDQGKQEVNLTISVPREAWQPVPGVSGKLHTTVECDHLAEVAGVSHLDMLGTEHGQITGMSLHKVEGLPTGAAIGVVVGHKISETGQIVPMQTNETVAHKDYKGSTHIYHALAVGKTPVGSDVTFKPAAEHELANESQVKAKVERWSHAEPHHVDFEAFTGKNAKGQTKEVAAVHTQSPLGELISRNESNKKFTATTGPIKKITNDGSDYFVLGKQAASKLKDGLQSALGPQTKWAKDKTCLRLFTDDATMIGTGAHPHTLQIKWRRDKAKHVADDRVGTGGELSSGGAEPVVDDILGDTDVSLAKAVFEGEDSVVSISAGTSDGAD